MLFAEYTRIAQLPDSVKERTKVKVDLFFKLLYDRQLRNKAHDTDFCDSSLPEWLRTLLGNVDFDKLQVESLFRMRNLKHGALKVGQNLPNTSKVLDLYFRVNDLEPYFAFGESEYFNDQVYNNPFEAFCTFLLQEFSKRMDLPWLSDLVKYEMGIWSYHYFIKYGQLPEASQELFETTEHLQLPEAFGKPFAMSFDYPVLELATVSKTEKIPEQVLESPLTVLLYLNEAGQVKMSRLKQRSAV